MPKGKVKRKYIKKTNNGELLTLPPELLYDPNDTPKQKNKLFHNLEEDHIILEEKERQKREEAKRKEIEKEEEIKSSANYKPYLECPF